MRRLADIRLIDYVAGAILWLPLLLPFYGALYVFFREDIGPGIKGLDRLDLVAFAFGNMLTQLPLPSLVIVLVAVAFAYRIRIILVAVASATLIGSLLAWWFRIGNWLHWSTTIEDLVWQVPFSLTNFCFLIAIAFSAIRVAMVPRETVGSFFKTNVRSVVSASLLGMSALIRPPRGRFAAVLVLGLLAAFSTALMFYVFLWGSAYRHFVWQMTNHLQACDDAFRTYQQLPNSNETQGYRELASCIKIASRRTMWNAVPVFLAAAVLLPLAMRLFGMMRWRALRQSLLSARSSDVRRPVLYLRPFTVDVDKVVPGRNHIAYNLIAPTRSNKSIEGTLLESLSTIGPVVAIGNPEDREPALGAARQYVADDQWRELIIDTMAAAQLVVIVAGNTPGVVWELDYAFKNATCEKLLIFPPSLSEGDAHRVGELLRQVTGDMLAIKRHHVGAYYSSNGAILLFSSDKRDASAYEALARYIAIRRTAI